MISPDTCVRDIAISRPGATAVFRRHKIDFCCNGAASLSQAAARRGLPVVQLQSELEALGPDKAGPPSDPSALIPHILTRYHEVHRAEFPEAIRLARRVEAVHRAKDDCPHGLADHL
ncbi:MAG: DUF542 domain-containing protein, partial [Pseudomonadota bacterium]